MDEIRVWWVKLAGRDEVFDDLDVAVAYLRAELASEERTWGCARITLESSWMDRKEYANL